MNKESIKEVFGRAFAGFLSIAMAIAFYFLLLRFGELSRTVSWLLRIMTPFIYGSVMAYLLKTPCNHLERYYDRHLPEKWRKWAPALAVWVVILIVGVMFYLLLSMVLPELVNSITVLTAAMPKYFNQFNNWVTDITEGNPVIQNYVSTAVSEIGEKLRAWSQSDLLPMLQNMMGSVAETVGSIVGFLSNLGIGIIICIYMLGGRKKLARQATAVLYAAVKPEKADRVLKEVHFIDKTFMGFFGGKILDSLLIGGICYAFCLIMTFARGFQNAMLISVIIAITNMIPYFGPYIGLVPAALLVVMVNPLNCVIFVVFILVLQQIDGNVLGPRLLAGSVGLSGLWVLFAITLFGGIFGFVGILVGVPVFAVIYDMLKRLVYKGLKIHGKTDVLR